MDIVNKVKKRVNDKVILIATITVILFSFILVNYTFSKEIIIRDFESEMSIKTMAFTVEDVIKRSDIELAKEDVLDYKLDDRLVDGMVINITRAQKVRIVNGGEEHIVTTALDNVATILEQNDIQVNEKDIIVPALDSVLKDDRTIKVIKVIEKLVTEEEVIPFDTEVVFNDTLDYDEYNVKNQGTNGLREVTYKVTYENGKETQRVFNSNKIITPPFNKVIEKAEEKYLVSSRGQVIRYKKVIIMEATAYDLSVGSTGKTPDHPEYGITFSGTRARPGVVAVDPRVIPLGSKLYVESLDSTNSYGLASAEDTGSAIKGKKIDLFMENSREAWRFGRRKVRVYVLD